MGKVHIPAYLLLLIDGDGDHVYDLNTEEEREQLASSLFLDEGFDVDTDQIVFIDLAPVDALGSDPIAYHYLGPLTRRQNEQ